MKALNEYMDLTLLRPEATEADIVRLCSDAREYSFYAVCVNPCYVKQAAALLKGSRVKIACTVGFPLGAATTGAKAAEAKEAAASGASETDMVMNIGMFKSGKADYVREEISAVVRAAASQDAIVKVIIETCLLSHEEIIRACLLAAEAGAAFVKTSTGFGREGAKIADVALMKKTVGDSMSVKAAGGIRNLGTALAMINAGADRLGVSAGVEIMREWLASPEK